jgi:hypothetical protein
MTPHDRRTPSISVAPNRDTPSATSTAFFLTRESVPCGSSSIRRYGRTHHTKLESVQGLMVMQLPEVRIAQSSDNRPIQGQSI